MLLTKTGTPTLLVVQDCSPERLTMAWLRRTVKLVHRLLLVNFLDKEAVVVQGLHRVVVVAGDRRWKDD